MTHTPGCIALDEGGWLCAADCKRDVPPAEPWTIEGEARDLVVAVLDGWGGPTVPVGSSMVIACAALKRAYDAGRTSRAPPPEPPGARPGKESEK